MGDQFALYIMTPLPVDRSATGERILPRRSRSCQTSCGGVTSEGFPREYHMPYKRLWELRLRPENINIYPSQYAITDNKMADHGCDDHATGLLSNSASNTATANSSPMSIGTTNNLNKHMSNNELKVETTDLSNCSSIARSQSLNFIQNDDGERLGFPSPRWHARGQPLYQSYNMLAFHRRKHARHPKHLPERFSEPHATSFDYGWRYHEMKKPQENALLWYPISSSPMTKFQDHLSQVGIKLKRK